MKFTNNEKSVLKKLLDNGRSSDLEVSKDIGISPQAVGKIRKKLEKEEIIKGYSVKLDFEKMGITSFALIRLEQLPSYWASEFEKRDMSQLLKIYP